MFLEISHCLLGQHGSRSSAKLPVELSGNMLQNLFLNLPPHSVRIYLFQELNVVRGNVAEVDAGARCEVDAGGRVVFRGRRVWRHRCGRG